MVRALAVLVVSLCVQIHPVKAFAAPQMALSSVRAAMAGPAGGVNARINGMFDGVSSGVGAGEAVPADSDLTATGVSLAFPDSVQTRAEKKREVPAPKIGEPSRLAQLNSRDLLPGIPGALIEGANRAEELGKIIDKEGERRAREGAQRQREAEERQTGRPSDKYPQYPDRTEEERKKDNGKYPRFDK